MLELSTFFIEFLWTSNLPDQRLRRHGISLATLIEVILRALHRSSIRRHNAVQKSEVNSSLKKSQNLKWQICQIVTADLILNTPQLAIKKEALALVRWFPWDSPFSMAFGFFKNPNLHRSKALNLCSSFPNFFFVGPLFESWRHSQLHPNAFWLFDTAINCQPVKRAIHLSLAFWIFLIP